MAVSTSDGKVYDSRMDFLLDWEDFLDLKGTNKDARSTEQPIIPLGGVNKLQNEQLKERIDNPPDTDNPMDFLGNTYVRT